MIEDANAALQRARAAFGAGEYGAALAAARAALAGGAPPVDALVLLANAAMRAAAWDDTLYALDRLRELFPDNVQFRRLHALAQNNRGSTLERRGLADLAQLEYDAALRTWPDLPEALYNLGRARLRAGDADGACALLERALAQHPDDLELELLLADATTLALRDDAPARVRALAPRVAPADRLVLARLAARVADAATVLGALDAAASVETLGAWLDVAHTLAGHGEDGAARDAFARLAKLGDHGRHAPSLHAEIGTRLTLRPVVDDVAELAAVRERYTRGLEALVAEFPASRVATFERRLDQLQWSNFLLAYQGGDDRALQRTYGTWLVRSAAALGGELAAPPEPSNGRRIALVSSFFRDTTIGAYFGRWAGTLAAAGFAVDVFQLGPRFDAVTERIGAAPARLHRLDGTLETAARAIRDVRADLVIYPELGMDARVLVLAALPLAARQVAAWGHPVTCGLPTIAAAFTAAAMEPPDAAAHYGERLVALPGIGTRYAAPPAPAERPRTALGLPARGRLYLVPQAAFKIHPDSDALLADVAARDPDATLVLFDNEHAGATRRLRERLERALRERGAAARQLLFLPMTPRERYLEINRACDVMVDTLHWSGGNTTIDALIAGLPVVTTPGRYMRGRQSAAMLAALGVAGDLVCADAGGVAERAVAIARDPVRRAELSRTIAERLPDVLDHPAAEAALVTAVEGLLAT